MRSWLIASVLLLSILGAEAQHADIRILRDIHVKRSPSLDPTFLVITHSATPISIAAPSSFFIHSIIAKDTGSFWKSAEIVGALGVSTAVTLAMKYSIDRARPDESFPEISALADRGSPSFPSGHTSVAFATATSATMVLPKWYIAVPAFTWASAVGYSRMHLGVHYPSDVLVGAVVGAGSAWVSHMITKKLREK